MYSNFINVRKAVT